MKSAPYGKCFIYFFFPRIRIPVKTHGNNHNSQPCNHSTGGGEKKNPPNPLSPPVARQKIGNEAKAGGDGQGRTGDFPASGIPGCSGSLWDPGKLEILGMNRAGTSEQREWSGENENECSALGAAPDPIPAGKKPGKGSAAGWDS